MFVSGETGEPSSETTGIIEEIVRGQVIEMVPFYYLLLHMSLRENTPTKPSNLFAANSSSKLQHKPTDVEVGRSQLTISFFLSVTTKQKSLD